MAKQCVREISSVSPLDPAIATSASTPTRTLYDIRRIVTAEHLGFGGDAHACLGSMVARMAVQIIFRGIPASNP